MSPQRLDRSVRGAAPLAAALVLVGLLAAGCTQSPAAPAPPEVRTALAAAPSRSAVLDGTDSAELAVLASRAVWQSSPVAVAVASDDPEVLAQAAAEAADLAVPLFAVAAADDAGSPAASQSAAPGGPAGEPSASGGPSASGPADPLPADDPGAVAGELDRLGVTHVLGVGAAPALDGVEVVSDPADLPEFEPAQPLAGVVALTAPKAAAKGAEQVALASLAAAGVGAVELTGADPRVSAEDVSAVAAADADVLLGVGAGFGRDRVFAERVEAAATGVQLPGGGQTIFDGKRYVALYGHPLTNALGVLGEQGPEASIARAAKVASTYEPYADEQIIPAFEIIATVASGSAGTDGNYSNEWDIGVLAPLVDAAAESGTYVVLDLQSGRADFLSQAKKYRTLLRQPHVGLAMDPEWRLKPGQRPMAQIGSVSAAELNEAIDWLAELTAANDLPQKMVLLHQFRTDMITQRETLHLDHDELAVIVQMDGDGTMGQKLATWGALLADAPDGLRFGWKNFYDEDEPTPSPATTFQVTPKPWWVSYQ